MSDILAEIIEYKKQFVADAKAARPEESVRNDAEQSDPPRNFFKAVTQPADRLHVIAEVKKASPSAGLICEDFDPVGVSTTYFENGAAAISCLTDEKYFQGKLEYIRQIRDAVPLPVLRKDFVVDPYQIYEARAAGADAVLLIAECLGEAELLDLIILATELKLTTLVEVHSVDNLLRIVPHIGFPHPQYTLLGINNRDLKQMKTDVKHTLRLLAMVEDTSVIVSESGIRTVDDVTRLRSAGVDRILVGEHLMRQDDIGKALRELINAPVN